jgi:hypothetical protein
MKKEKNIIISLVIPEGLKEIIQKEAEKDDRRYTALIRKILKSKYNYK